VRSSPGSVVGWTAIPLAVELAAARVRLLSVEQIASRLDDRFDLLAGGSRTALPSYRTLRGAIDWSYELLGEEERALLRRLAVFAGGWTLEAAERVTSGELGAASGEPDDSQPATRNSLLDVLGSLVDKSVVQVETTERSEPRYRFLEMIQQYALERLREASEEAGLRRRHLAWFADFAVRGQAGMLGPDAPSWMARLVSDLDNVRAALAWSVADPIASSAWDGLRMAGAQSMFWFYRFQIAEGRHWLERVLQADALHAQDHGTIGASDVLTNPLGEHPRVAAMHAWCVLSEDAWDPDEATRRAEEMLALARALHDPIGPSGRSRSTRGTSASAWAWKRGRRWSPGRSSKGWSAAISKGRSRRAGCPVWLLAEKIRGES
jgi:hypothetical protein